MRFINDDREALVTHVSYFVDDEWELLDCSYDDLLTFQGGEELPLAGSHRGICRGRKRHAGNRPQ